MNLLKKAFQEFSEDQGMQMSAALAFYTMLSLAPLLVVVVTAASLIMGPQAKQEFIEQAGNVVGPQGAEEIEELLNRGQQPIASGGTSSEAGSGEADKQAAAGAAEGSGWSVTTVIMNVASILLLIFSATGIMAQLQASLNQLWEVEPDPEQSGVASFVKKRLLSLVMLLAIAFLLLVSMVLTTMLGVFGEWISETLGIGQVARYAISEGTTFVIVTLLFAAMFKVLPDAQVPWRVTWMGAILTALLFTVGKFLIGLYLGQKDMGSAYGQAGSLVLLLLWVYYSAIIFFFGAELTQVWARRRGAEIAPSPGAVRVVHRSERIR